MDKESLYVCVQHWKQTTLKPNVAGFMKLLILTPLYKSLYYTISSCGQTYQTVHKTQSLKRRLAIAELNLDLLVKGLTAWPNQVT